MTPPTFALVLAQLAAVAIVSWGIGALVTPRLQRKLSEDETFGLPERVLLSVLGFFAWTVALMVVHLVSGGAAFGNPAVVPLASIVLVVVAVRRMGLPSIPRPSKRVAGVLILGALLLALYALPVVLAGSGVRTGDLPWHLGWTEQLLDGQPVPTGPAPEFGRNAYPWGYHSLLATIVRLVPGSDPLIAHEVVHLLLLAAIPLAAAALARLVNPRAGLAAAWSSALVGGFGWVVSGTSAFVAIPGDARYGADLVVASPNSMYELFPPALPREVALVALGAAGVLLARALRTRDRGLQIASGGAIGLVGLISVPMFVTAVAWAVVASLLVMRSGRITTLMVVLASALGVFGLWAGPVLSDHIRFDGFVNITPALGVEWPLLVALSSWGLLLPLALGGLALVIAQPPIVGRPLISFVIGSVALFLLSVARRAYDWGLLGNETLLHQGRIWPSLHLLGAALAGIALVAGYGWLRARARPVAVVLVALVVMLGVASPVIAARGLSRILEKEQDGYVYADLHDEESFVRRAAEYLDSHDVVRVEGSNNLGFLLFQFSGVTLAAFDNPGLQGNDLRIRFSDLAERWDARIASGGFDPDYIVEVQEGPVVDDIASGDFAGRLWVLRADD